MIIPLTTLIAAIIAGPLVVLLAQRQMLVGWVPSRTESAGVGFAAGAAVALAADPALGATVLPMAVLGLAAAVVDAREGRLPDRLTGPLVLVTGAAALTHAGLAAFGAVVAPVAVTALVATLLPDAVGWGDVKLVPSVALVAHQRGTGAETVTLVLALAVVTALAVASGSRRRGELVPYGPALVLGALATPCA